MVQQKQRFYARSHDVPGQVAEHFYYITGGKAVEAEPMALFNRFAPVLAKRLLNTKNRLLIMACVVILLFWLEQTGCTL